MSKVEKSYFIDRPRQEVFDFVTDAMNDPKWRESTTSTEWTTDGPIGVGSKYKSTDKFLGRTLEYSMEYTAWNPPNMYAGKSVGGPIPVKFSMRFETEGSGTRVTIDSDIELEGIFKLAGGLLSSQLDKQFDTEWTELKRIMEG